MATASGDNKNNRTKIQTDSTNNSSLPCCNHYDSIDAAASDAVWCDTALIVDVLVVIVVVVDKSRTPSPGTVTPIRCTAKPTSQVPWLTSGAAYTLGSRTAITLARPPTQCARGFLQCHSYSSNSCCSVEWVRHGVSVFLFVCLFVWFDLWCKKAKASKKWSFLDRCTANDYAGNQCVQLKIRIGN